LHNYHVCRFLALCHVVEVLGEGSQKFDAKAQKFMHALGLQSLWTMDRITATSIPDGNLVVVCPYTDKSYDKEKTDDNAQPNGTTSHHGSGKITQNDTSRLGSKCLSGAQARRILNEEGTAISSNANMLQVYTEHLNRSSESLLPSLCCLQCSNPFS